MKDKALDEPPGGGLLGQENLQIKKQQPVRIPNQSGLLSFSTVTKMIKRLKPDAPVHCIRPHVIATAAKWFISTFPGNVMYSVKSNPDSVVMKHLYNAGIRHFDVASIPEIQQVNELFPNAKMYFMHPVKSREAIRRAYFDFHIRDFSLDSSEELQKILEVTQSARDLSLHIRLDVKNPHANHDLSGKFGCAGDEAVKLLKLARKVSYKLGICFHVGSQCMNPEAYKNAIFLAKELTDKAKVKLDSLDIGGGFPSIYPGLIPPSLSSYMASIYEAFKQSGFDKNVQLFCEPGRALVAEAGSVVVRVELRKDQALYINDGIYGSLFDAGFPNLVYPTRLITASGRSFKRQLPFTFFGPTCDSLDTMKGPFYLPVNVMEGDWIEIGQVGAYGSTLQTKFNGFYSDTTVEIWDDPMMSMYGFSDKTPVKELEHISPKLD